MPFDGLVLAAVRNELQEKLAGGRIEKIYQPEKEGLVLSFLSFFLPCSLGSL